MKNTLKNLFRSPFNLEEYTRTILSGLLHAQRINARPELLEETSDGDIVYGLGILEDVERKRIGLFYTEVRHSDVTRKRVGLRRVVEPYIKANVDAALAVFDDGRHWRLSYICDLREGSTSAKRFSYILGDENGQYKTPLERLEKVAKLSGRLRLSDLRESFSVDALSDEFFDEYHIHYDRIVATLTQSYRSDAMHGFSADSVSTTRLHDYVKKMMGRIVFLHFLQKKGWLCGDPDFMRNTFRRCARQEDYLESVLEPLFFGMLNAEPEHREEVFRNHHWDIDLLHQWQPAQNTSSSLISNSSLNSIPYLNGGLFEEDDVDRLRVRLPGSMFRELFDFLASYNFTVDENDPDDAEIGVDPEMLGKIFESLLEDNKAKGAFYTPKEIVRYMCKESLIAYLGAICFPADGKTGNTCVPADGKNTDCGDAVGSLICTFVETHEFPDELEPYRDVLDRALREVKICDPAIGSGAFPMGLLNELWRCREAISSQSTSLSSLEEAKLSVTPYKAAGRSVVTGTNSVENTRLLTRLELKKQIIENNIYGVDIERGAIDIARLRFWLSIVVDSDEPAPLPNFDYKFMQGNSLIESFEGVDLSRMMDGGARSSLGRGKGKAGENQLAMEYSTDDTKRNLQLMLKEYFSLTDHREKAAARASINDSVKRYIRQQGLHPSTEARLTALDPSANQEFFLWHTWFKDIFDRGGFDIVVGNPPYVARLDAEYKETLGKIYPEAKKKIFDLYNFFMVFSLQILSLNSGVSTMIVPPTWLNNKNSNKLRKAMALRGLSQVDYLDENVFENAIVYSCIYFTNVNVKEEIQCNLTKIVNGEIVSERRNNVPISSVKKEGAYIPLDKSKGLVERIKNTIHVILLGEISNIVFGIQDRKSANDPSYIHAENPGQYKRVLNGKHIGQYYIQDSGLFIDYGPWLWNPRKKEVFECLEKILVRQVGKYPICAYDNEQFYTLNTIYNIIIKDMSFDTKYVLAVLNSKLMQNIWKEIYPEQKDVFPRLKKEQLVEIPIPIVSFEQQKQITKIVDQILVEKKKNPNANTSALEREIDRLVYGLYGLTEEEVKVVECKNV